MKTTNKPQLPPMSEAQRKAWARQIAELPICYNAIVWVGVVPHYTEAGRAAAAKWDAKSA